MKGLVASTSWLLFHLPGGIRFAIGTLVNRLSKIWWWMARSAAPLFCSGAAARSLWAALPQKETMARRSAPSTTRFCSARLVRFIGFTILCLVLLSLSARAGAVTGWRATVETATNSGIHIELASPIEHPPPSGCMPCWITIRNRSGAAHTWTIRCQGSSPWGSARNSIVSSQELRVEGGEAGRLALLLPVAPPSDTMYYYQVSSVLVEGYAVLQAANAAAPPDRHSNSMETAFIGMGDALATPLWGPLTKSFEDRKIDLIGSPVDISLLGPDWRALAGFKGLWLTDAEYASLDAPGQLAIRHWIDQGGNFYLCTRNLDPAARAGLGLGASDTAASPGYGQVKLIPWDGKELPVETVSGLIDQLSLPADDTLHNASGWRMAKSLGAIPVNATFLIGFICVFAVLVGPVNLFWLAGAGRRHRLFWTTPLISLVSSLLLIAVIILQDGFGGAGERSLVALILPDEKQAVVWQEQVTRTGVTLSRQFTTSEDVLLTPVKARFFSGKTFEQSGRSYGGDWFASRSVQAQRAEAIVPSRAEIQLLNATAARRGAAPVVVSSLPASLKEIHYTDAAHHAWRGGSLRTGERITLERDEHPAAFDVMEGSNQLFKPPESICTRPGYFYALADNGPFLDTLASIRWKKQRAVFLGPVTSAGH